MMNSIELVDNKFETSFEFEIIRHHISLDNAKIDTGCAHSLIGYNATGIKITKENLFKRAITSKGYRLTTGVGVESNKRDIAWLNELVNEINKSKGSYIGLSLSEIEQELMKSLNISKPGILDKAFKSPNIRVQVPAKDVEVSGINIGNAYLRIGLNNSDKILIGMYLLKRMHMVMIRDQKNTYINLLDRNIANIDILKRMTNLAYGPDEVLKMIDN